MMIFTLTPKKKSHTSPGASCLESGHFKKSFNTTVLWKATATGSERHYQKAAQSWSPCCWGQGPLASLPALHHRSPPAWDPSDLRVKGHLPGVCSLMQKCLGLGLGLFSIVQTFKNAIFSEKDIYIMIQQQVCLKTVGGEISFVSTTNPFKNELE